MNKRNQIHADLIRLRDNAVGPDKTTLRRAIDEWEKMSREIKVLRERPNPPSFEEGK